MIRGSCLCGGVRFEIERAEGLLSCAIAVVAGRSVDLPISLGLACAVRSSDFLTAWT